MSQSLIAHRLEVFKMSENHQPKDADVCCPVFDPVPWDGVSHQWTDKLFLCDSVPQFFHMPLPGIYGKTISRMWDTATKLGIAPETKDFMLLAYDPSPWKSELYMTVTADHHEVDVARFNGTYVSKVYDGPYNKVPEYMKDFDAYLDATHQKAEKYYFYYTTCPKCAKKYGHNYIVAIAKI